MQLPFPQIWNSLTIDLKHFRTLSANFLHRSVVFNSWLPRPPKIVLNTGKACCILCDDQYSKALGFGEAVDNGLLCDCVLNWCRILSCIFYISKNLFNFFEMWSVKYTSELFYRSYLLSFLCWQAWSWWLWLWGREVRWGGVCVAMLVGRGGSMRGTTELERDHPPKRRGASTAGISFPDSRRKRNQPTLNRKTWHPRARDNQSISKIWVTVKQPS